MILHIRIILYPVRSYLDGYKVLCISDITKIKRGEIEKFHDEIIYKEGILDLLCTPKISISSWNVFFSTMMKENKLIDISLEKVQDETTFFVGKIKSARKDYLELQEVDALGNYKHKITKLYYKDITLVSFGNRYSELLDKYLYNIKK